MPDKKSKDERTVQAGVILRGPEKTSICVLKSSVGESNYAVYSFKNTEKCIEEQEENEKERE